MDNRAVAEVALTTFVTNMFLILAIIMILVRTRTPEMRLILLGIFLGIAAGAQGQIAGVAVNGQNVALVGGFGAATLTKLSVILTLAGVGMMFLARTIPPPIPAADKEPPHVA
jgi:hypothetical protein